MNKTNFIHVFSGDLAKMLVNQGYTQIAQSDNRWTFLDCNKLTFSEIDESQLIRNNVLNV